MIFEVGDWVVNRGTGQRGRYKRAWTGLTVPIDEDSIDSYERYQGPNPRRFLNCDDWCVVVGETLMAHYATECVLEKIEPFEVSSTHRLLRDYAFREADGNRDRITYSTTTTTSRIPIGEWERVYAQWTESLRRSAVHAEDFNQITATWRP